METGLTLTGDMMLVLVVLTATIGLFVSELIRVDIAAILVMVVIGLLGLVPATDLFNGFASNAVLSIIAVMILGAGLDRTGVMTVVAAYILKSFHMCKISMHKTMSFTLIFSAEF